MKRLCNYLAAGGLIVALGALLGGIWLRGGPDSLWPPVALTALIVFGVGIFGGMFLDQLAEERHSRD
jgi:hypothetical protein